MLQPDTITAPAAPAISGQQEGAELVARPVPLPRVSVIIPAYNAQATLGRTLESLRAQTYRNWEAIVVDDGSSDDTAGVAEDSAGQDARIRLVLGLRMGVSMARNAGLGRARAEWILFLDADDVITPDHLEKMLAEAGKDRSCNIVVCHWARVGPDGRTLHVSRPALVGDGFKVLARTCAFAIHACIVRRSLIEEVGKFDPHLRTCEDWDLWHRIARSGAVFRTVPQVLAHYCVRPASASMDAARMFGDALRVMERAYGPDERVRRSAHPEGMPRQELAAARLNWICWPAALLIGQGQDPMPLLELVKEDAGVQLDPESVANQIFEAALLPTCEGPEAWPGKWTGFEPKVDGFLSALESHTGTKALARRAKDSLARNILKRWSGAEALTLGRGHARRVEVTQPIEDVQLPAGIERLFVRVELEGKFVEAIELPVCDGLVPAAVIADAIASDVGWRILGVFFSQNVYDESAKHDEVGWLTLLQELWAKPDWDNAKFYCPQESPGNYVHVEGAWHVVEVSEELSGIETRQQAVDVVLTVGGAAVCSTRVAVKSGRVSSHELMTALIKSAGAELCRVAVREALVGRPVYDGKTLRQRLAEAAKWRSSEARRALPTIAGVSFAPGSERTWASALGGDVIALAHRRGGSSGQFALLPSGAAEEILRMAHATQQPVPRLGDQARSGQPPRVAHAPDLLWRTEEVHRDQKEKVSSAKRVEARQFSRGWFELAHAKSGVRPHNEYEQRKRQQLLSLLPPGVKRALEVGCGDGQLTELLAQRVEKLVATDISQIAVERTAARHQELTNVEFRQADASCDSLDRPFDLIVCSEVLYYMNDYESLRKTIARLVDLLAPNGLLVTAHANLVADDPEDPGFDWDLPYGAKTIEEVVSRARRLCAVERIETPLYRIGLYRRQSLLRSMLLPARPVVREEESARPVGHVLWSGGRVRHEAHAPIQTARLPILMYHRVSPVGSEKMRRWRVTPEQFEQQLKFLRDDGYYSVTFEEWAKAARARRALPGRAVIITFDDGYQDFYDYAFPLLKKYQFGAYVFLVAQRVGKTNVWDKEHGEEIFLMAWDAIRKLKSQGVRFGSHTATHMMLATESNVDVVKEVARSREILAKELGEAVNSFAYPYGSFDPAVAQLVGACGFEFAVTCRNQLAGFTEPMLQLPRVEVFGDGTFEKFVFALNGLNG